MDRVARFNVLAMSGRAVEASGDVDVILLDKTGTITYGNRLASSITAGARRAPRPRSLDGRPRRLDPRRDARGPLDRRARPQAARASSAGPAATGDDAGFAALGATIAEEIPFRAETRTSGVRTDDGDHRPQGRRRRDRAPTSTAPMPPEVARRDRPRSPTPGATPLAIRSDGRVLGLIELKDTVKEGLVERFAEFRKMGIRTVMITGDNPRTAATIAREAGVDDFIAQATPEDKIALHPQASRPTATSSR